MKRLCSIPGCTRLHRAKGRCTLHYNRQREGIPDDQRVRGRPARDVPLSKQCRLPGCGRKARSFGLCQAHRTKQLHEPGAWSAPLIPHPAAEPLAQLGDVAVPERHWRVLEEEARARGVKRAHLVREAVAALVERVLEEQRQRALSSRIYDDQRYKPVALRE